MIEQPTKGTVKANQSPRLSVEHNNEIAFVTFPRNEVDGNAIREMYETAASLMDRRSPRMMINFTGVPMVSSSAMGMLVTIKKKFLQVGGQMHVVLADARVMKSFELMNLHLVLKLFTDAGEAEKQFKD